MQPSIPPNQTSHTAWSHQMEKYYGNSFSESSLRQLLNSLAAGLRYIRTSTVYSYGIFQEELVDIGVQHSLQHLRLQLSPF